jgi:feruloyl esterase
MRAFASLLASCALLACHAAQALTEPGCLALASKSIEAAAIGLPTGGATVAAAKMVAADDGRGGSGVSGAHGGYCLLSGVIRSVDPNAENIHFEVALPANWNGKALMRGGGGFDGVIPNLAGSPPNAPANAPTPLARGYAVFGSDSGHQSTPGTNPLANDPNSGRFFQNEEEYRNYMSDALKKTHDVALVLIKDAYGRTPRKSYFYGGSKGGGEGLMVAARWPADWDGIVALYPAQNFVMDILGFLATSQALAAPGAYLDMAKRGVLHKAALATCDELDGARDGIISDVARCNAVFDPSTATLNGQPVRCAGGVDAGDTCLSDAQIAALEKVSKPTQFGFSLAGEDSRFPGFPVMTADLGNSSTAPLEAVMPRVSIGTTQPTSPLSEGNALATNFSDNFMRFAVAREPTFNQLAFDLSQGGAMTQRLTELSASGTASADLTGFADRKGKLIIVQGTEDMMISPRATEQYYRQVQSRMGADRVRGFLRFYEVPGFGHTVSSVFDARWDGLTALEDWVESGKDPQDRQVATDMTGVPGRQRPLCLFPSWPQYRGNGDMNRAASFTCFRRPDSQ